jgi:hypothetical protein
MEDKYYHYNLMAIEKYFYDNINYAIIFDDVDVLKYLFE